MDFSFFLFPFITVLCFGLFFVFCFISFPAFYPGSLILLSTETTAVTLNRVFKFEFKSMLHHVFCMNAKTTPRPFVLTDEYKHTNARKSVYKNSFYILYKRNSPLSFSQRTFIVFIYTYTNICIYVNLQIVSVSRIYM